MCVQTEMVLNALPLAVQVLVLSKYSSYNDIPTYFNVKISGQQPVNIMYTYRFGWRESLEHSGFIVNEI